MADWIAEFKPNTVVMESTGIYWKSPYAALEKVGLQALVVNAQHVKKVPSRKTDTSNAEWLAMLACASLLRGSFIPPTSLQNLRQLSRYHHRTTAIVYIIDTGYGKYPRAFSKLEEAQAKLEELINTRN